MVCWLTWRLRRTQTFSTDTPYSFSPDEQHVALVQGQHLRVYSLTTLQQLCAVAGTHAGRTHWFCWSSDSTLVAASVTTYDRTTTLLVIDTATCDTARMLVSLAAA